jgi:hypothetical protein
METRLKKGASSTELPTAGHWPKCTSTHVGNNISAKYPRRIFMLPKRRFWKEEQQMKSGFSQHFSTVSSPNRVLTPLKSAAKILISSFVHPSKIFVWDG